MTSRILRGLGSPLVSALILRPTRQGFDLGLRLGHVSPELRLIVPLDPCPDITEAVGRDVQPYTTL